ncbi:PAS domain-containing sensor histidine kinase [Pseudoneobacillus sp. C159]
MNHNHAFFQEILNYTSDILMIVDQNRHIKYITPNFYTISGYKPEEFYNRDTFDMIHPEDKEYLLARHRNLLASKQSNSSEYRVITKNGEVLYCECKTTPLPDTEGYLQVVSTRDITDRKLLELELERHKNRHEVLQRSLKSFSNDLSTVMKVNDLEERLIKELRKILPNSNPIIINSHPKNKELSKGKLESFDDKLLIKIGERHKDPYILSIISKSIQEKMDAIWLETLAFYAVMVFENLAMIEGLMSQIDTALQSNETPQWVLRMMFNLQEQQRLTLSSDLHDTVLQDQIDLYRRMESIIQRYEIDEEAKSKLKDIEQGILDIIHDIRQTCNHLRPPLLRELGLESALENLFDHIQVSSTYKIIFTSEGIKELALTEEQTITIYRIVQELLQYVEEQSSVTCIKFAIRSDNDDLTLKYSDDGERNNPMQHIGLSTISQRAKSLGGKIELFSDKGIGLKVNLELPINEKGVYYNGKYFNC